MKLFVASNVGQLNKTQDIILKKEWESNILCVLYGRNLDILKNIKKQINENLFDEIIFLKLPNKNIEFNKRNQKKIYKMYAEIFTKNKIEEIYLFSFEYHYNYFEELAKKSQAKLNLIEEGLAMYKPIIPLKPLTKKEQLKISIKELLKEYKKIYNNSLLYRAIKELRNLAIYKVLKVSYLFLYEIVEIIFDKKNDKYLEKFYLRIREFENIYAVFPRFLDGKFTAKKIEKINFDYNILNENIETLERNEIFNKIDSDSIIFINQEYNIFKDIHVDIILSYLKEKYGRRNIFIKFHPREGQKNKDAYSKYIKENNLENVFCLNLDVEIPLEVILQKKKPYQLVGLTSTSLVYSKEIVNNIKTISIGNYYLGEIKKYKKIEQKYIDVFNNHLDILKNFEKEVEII